MSKFYANRIYYRVFRQCLVGTTVETVLALSGIVGGQNQGSIVPNEQDGGKGPTIKVGSFRKCLDE